MISAVQQEVVSSDFKISKTAAGSIVNMDFLRSGAEFKTDAPVAAGDSRDRSLSNNERLQKFHEITQAAGTSRCIILY